MMLWEINWPKVKRRRSLPVLSSTAIPNPNYANQPNHVQFLPPVEQHPSFRQPFAHMIRKPVPSSGPIIAPEVTRLNIQNTNIAQARILFQTDSYIISSLPGKDPQDVLNAIRQDVIPYKCTHGHNTCCQHEDANRYHQRLSPVLSAHDASDDDDLQLPPVRQSTPLGFGQYEFSCTDSVNSSMPPCLQFHPDTPIGGHEAAPIRTTGPTEKRYKTPRIKFSSPGENNHAKWSKARKERHSSSSYIPPNYPTQVDGNNSHSQTSKAEGTQYCCTLGHNEVSAPPSSSCCPPECLAKITPGSPDTPSRTRGSCFAQECVSKSKPDPPAPSSHIEKWRSEMEYRNYMATQIPSIDGANTPPEPPMTSISNPPCTSIRHSQSAPTAPLPIPIENTDENPDPPTPGNHSKLKDNLRNKRGQRSRQGLRKFRKLIFRKGVLKTMLGRQLAQPTADLLDMMAKGIEFDPPDMKGFAKAPVEAPGGGLPV